LAGRIFPTLLSEEFRLAAKIPVQYGRCDIQNIQRVLCTICNGGQAFSRPRIVQRG